MESENYEPNIYYPVGNRAPRRIRGSGVRAGRQNAGHRRQRQYHDRVQSRRLKRYRLAKASDLEHLRERASGHRPRARLQAIADQQRQLHRESIRNLASSFRRIRTFAKRWQKIPAITSRFRHVPANSLRSPGALKSWTVNSGYREFVFLTARRKFLYSAAQRNYG